MSLKIAEFQSEYWLGRRVIWKRWLFTFIYHQRQGKILFYMLNYGVLKFYQPLKAWPITEYQKSVYKSKVLKFWCTSSYLLEGYHSCVDNSNVIDGIADEPRLIIQWFCIPHIVAHFYPPRKEQYLPLINTKYYKLKFMTFTFYYIQVVSVVNALYNLSH